MVRASMKESRVCPPGRLYSSQKPLVLILSEFVSRVQNTGENELAYDVRAFCQCVDRLCLVTIKGGYLPRTGQSIHDGR